MKLKSIGKVYPSPPPEDYLSIFNLLPAAIFALASVLSLEDRQVLAYMITRSLKTTAGSLMSQGFYSQKKNLPRRRHRPRRRWPQRVAVRPMCHPFSIAIVSNATQVIGSAGTLPLTVRLSIKLLKLLMIM
ncbi:hypothetical protein V6N12_033981 [Hibiscus sabdariffa]|uniref:Uncharacterized protein n=1 Tax=Hibiscus sabdariffa TaxID=183260 RepID=A0ABR2A0V7_9ROSI